MPSLSYVREQLDELIRRTKLDQRSAAKLLQDEGYNAERAVSRWKRERGNGGYGPVHAPDQLRDLFNSLRTTGETEGDTLNMDSCLAYYTSLNINLEDASLFVALFHLQAPSLTSLPRAAFYKAWTNTPLYTLQQQAEYLARATAVLSNNISVFREVYRHAFVTGREQDQKALDLTTAVTFWQVLFVKPGWEWRGEATGRDWLSAWIEFVQKEHSKSVNKDMWNQTFEFAILSRGDERLRFWDEEAAWPGVIDAFAEWSKAKFGIVDKVEDEEEDDE